MTAFAFKHVHLESYAVNLPGIEVSSASIEDKLSPLYERLEIPFGTLERLSGVQTRYFYEKKISPSKAGTPAVQKVLDSSGIAPEKIGALFSCSVTRDYFEPATASLVQRNVGLSESIMSLDISNACLGFSNGLMMLGNLIETGVVKAGLLVSGETISSIVDTSIGKILGTASMTRDELLRLLPTFTLGSGAAAFLLCHESIATKPHKILGGISRSASEYNDLCVGNADFCFFMDDLDPLMHTDSTKLIPSAALVGQRTWQEAGPFLGWDASSIDRIFCHQVGKQLGDAFFKTMGLDNSKEFSIYKKYGNQVSAALPSALVLGSDQLTPGSKVLLTGFGSGINTVFTGILW